MLRGITTYYNRIPKFVLHIIHFVPVLLTATYLVIISAIVLPLAVATCFVVVPLLYVCWKAKQNSTNATFLRIMYPFELVGLTIVNAPQIVATIVARTKKIKRPSLPSMPALPSMQVNTAKVNRGKAMMIGIRILAILGVIGVACYLVVVAAVVVPLAIGLCLVAAPFCYILWAVKEKKLIPMFHKIPSYLEHIGFNIVNSRKIMTNLMVGLKGFKWPML